MSPFLVGQRQMPQHIQIEPKDEYLNVEVSGVFDSVKAKEFIRQILATSQQHSLSKILVDIRNVEGPIPTMGRYELACFMAAEQVVPVRLAVLEFHRQVPDNRFFENVAENRGAIVKVTTSLEEALEWLEIKPAILADKGGSP